MTSSCGKPLVLRVAREVGKTKAIKRFGMCFYVLMITLSSCATDSSLKKSKNNISMESIKPVLSDPGNISTIRPAYKVLSEEEILLKAADYVIGNGFLHPDYSIYDEQPRLLDAIVETPIFEYSLSGYAGDVGGSYLLHAVDSSGDCLLQATVRAHEDVPESKFLITQKVSTDDYDDYHILTKREAMQIARDKFPGKKIRGPVAVRLDVKDVIFSSGRLSWYFSVETEGQSRSGPDYEYSEYLIDSFVDSFSSVRNEYLNNPKILDDPETLANALVGTRLSRIEEPLHLIEKIEGISASSRKLDELGHFGEIVLVAVPF